MPRCDVHWVQEDDKNSSSPFAQFAAPTHQSADPGVLTYSKCCSSGQSRSRGAPGPFWRRPNDQNVRTCASVWHALASLGLRQPFVSRLQMVHILVLTSGPHDTEKGKKLDSRCTMSLGIGLRLWATAGRNSTPWALIPDSDGPGEDVKPFLPHFLSQEIIFAHSPYDDLSPNQPSGQSSVPNEQHASQVRKSGRSGLSTTEGFVDSTEHHQAGVYRIPLHHRPDSGSSLRRGALCCTG